MESAYRDSSDARIGSSSFIVGKIEGEGNLIIEGRVEGSIFIKGDLQIEAGAQVKSTVQARNIFVMGLLVGDAVAMDRIELAPSGRMIGDVRAPRFSIGEGAAFRGRVEMVDFPVSERPAELARPQRSVASTQAARNGVVARSAAPSPMAPRRPEPRRDALPLRTTPARPASVSPASNTSNGGMSSNATTQASPAGAGNHAAQPPTSVSQVQNRASNLYTPPPLPRPPELAGGRKAIIIKKKSDGS